MHVINSLNILKINLIYKAMLVKIVIIGLSILVLILFRLWRMEKAYGKFYWERWDYFEGEYYKVYKAWIKKLSPDELKRVQQHGIDRKKEDYELTEELKEPL